MGVAIDVTYQGGLHCEAIHGPSRRSLETDAPVDNNGRGESFSPTDLLATAFATCMLTVMNIAAKKHGVELTGAKAHVQKEMIADPRRRVSSLHTTITVPAAVAGIVPTEVRKALEHAALTCPVQESLLPAIAREITFVWDA